MPIAPELVLPRLEPPTSGPYEELLEGHDWETHLPPSPEGRLFRTIDFCPECGASVHFLTDRRQTIVAAGFKFPGRSRAALFILQNGRMEPATAQVCRQALQHIDPDRKATGFSREPRVLEPEDTPPFPDMLHRHRWKQGPESADPGERIHDCAVCNARMRVILDETFRIAQVRVRLPGGRECRYNRTGNYVAPAAGQQST